MIRKCRVCGKAEFVQIGNGNQLDISFNICASQDCANIYRVWSTSLFISGAYSLDNFAQQIYEERRRAK